MLQGNIPAGCADSQSIQEKEEAGPTHDPRALEGEVGRVGVGEMVLERAPSFHRELSGIFHP